MNSTMFYLFMLMCPGEPTAIVENATQVCTTVMDEEGPYKTLQPCRDRIDRWKTSSIVNTAGTAYFKGKEWHSRYACLPGHLMEEILKGVGIHAA